MKCVYVRTDLYMKLHTELGRLCYLQANPDKFHPRFEKFERKSTEPGYISE